MGVTFTVEEWEYMLTLSKTIACDTKILDIHFKICKWDTTVSALCVTCNQMTNISHNFSHYISISKIWPLNSRWQPVSHFQTNTMGTISTRFNIIPNPIFKRKMNFLSLLVLEHEAKCFETFLDFLNKMAASWPFRKTVLIGCHNVKVQGYRNAFCI